MASVVAHPVFPLRTSSQRHRNPSQPFFVPLLESDTLYASDTSDLYYSDHYPQSTGPDTAEQGSKNKDPRSSSFRSRTNTVSSISSTTSSPVRRKPLPVTASPLATRFSSKEYLATTFEVPEPPFVRPYSIDSPTLHDFPPISTASFAPQDFQRQSYTRASDEPGARASKDLPSSIRKTYLRHSPSSSNGAIPLKPFPKDSHLLKHARLASDSLYASGSGGKSPWQSDISTDTHRSRSTMSIFSTKPTPPHDTHPAQLTSSTRSYSYDSNGSDATIQKALPVIPRSPGNSKLGTFFGWKGTNSPNSSNTTFSEDSYSPIPSPYQSESSSFPDASRSAARNIPSALNIPKTNADVDSYFGDAYLQLPLATSTPGSPFRVEDMEQELKEISAELAGSIRREMDLEDLVDRLQAEVQNRGQRTSDYFSDSGAGSIRYGDPDHKTEELERAIRKTEQEKALLRIELGGKVQDEKLRRKQLESQIRSLEDKASQIDLASINSLSTNGRLRELEATCENLRRRLAEERQVNSNFEDLLTALKGELQSSHNERDNLRDEVIPQLRAQVEGLEAQAAEHEKLAYEQSKMQQELQRLKDHNVTLIQSQRMQDERTLDHSRELQSLKENNYTLIESHRSLEEQSLSDQSRIHQELQALKDHNTSLIESQISHDELTSDHSRMQKELQMLKDHNLTLLDSQRSQSEMTLEQSKMQEELQTLREHNEDLVERTSEQSGMQQELQMLRSQNVALVEELQELQMLRTQNESLLEELSEQSNMHQELQTLKEQNVALVEKTSGHSIVEQELRDKDIALTERTSEHSKIQQELQTLKEQNLFEQSKIQQELQALRDQNDDLMYSQKQQTDMLSAQARMEEELRVLRDENAALVNAQKNQNRQQQLNKFNTILEDTASISPLPAKRGISGLGRSNSVVAQSTVSKSRTSSLSRSTSVKSVESRDALAERVKDVELQRDALHSALKSLLERQEFQNRENQKKIRQLEMERDKALSSSSRRIGYDEEVANLREEITNLRRRAEDAIEQKWQCEKGLGGLKMDLDRAEQEIESLRCLLDDHDILMPHGEFERPRSASSQISSASLEQAYRDLQKAYKESMDRIRSLEMSGSADEDTERAMRQLEQSLAEAISERDAAQEEADALREQTSSMYESEKNHAGEELELAQQLRDSAMRVEDLSYQVRQQLEANATLRQRLSDTIQRGDSEQKTNSQKIMFMQTRLKTLEERLVAAQQATEDKVSQHEDDIRNLKQSHNTQLHRMKNGLKSPRIFGPKSPLSPMFSMSSRSPRILSTTSGKAMTVSEDSKMEFLKQRVIELEGALADADGEMEEVVGRMNIAQIEVMELQNEREEAVRQTKMLQRRIEEEKLRAFEGKFASLSL